MHLLLLFVAKMLFPLFVAWGISLSGVNAGLSKQRPTTIEAENRTEGLFKLQKV
jgi:hypothetical protein